MTGSRSDGWRRNLRYGAVLLALVVACLVAAAPAVAFDEWIHGGIRNLPEPQWKSICDASGCHTGQTRSNASCLQSGCHPGLTTAGAKLCWDCHQPGTAVSVACSGTCHLYSGSGSELSYSTAFTHGETPHLGASGYGKTCVDCHGAGGAHHDAAAASTPTCAQCHNGTYAKAPTGHGTYSSDCASCHKGMDRPSSDCASCHVGNPSSGGPQITYSNDLTCADAGCHAKVKNHAGTPISAAACTTCHAAHYETLGACTKCHPDPQTFHHATARATPLAQCATCHNGGIARAPSAHGVYGATCANCHKGMDRPSTECASCHVGHPGTGASQVTYTNDLTCADAGCHAKVKNHGTTPIKDAACTTCHTAHYEKLGACGKCHPSPETFHHGTAKSIALAQCTKCHDGGIAAAPSGHSVYPADCARCHSGMDKPSGECASCHVGKPSSGATQITYTNDLTCADAGCHAKVKSHVGTPIKGAVCTTCHTAHYATLGACDKCHANPQTFHHGTAKSIPLAQCGTCHDGGIAKAPTGHDAYGKTCANCHKGMDRPSADCASCHVGNAGTGAPQVTYTNDRTCADAGCHAKVKNHAGTPITAAACTTCHEPHYETLGTCTKCHPDPQTFHHGTTRSVPLADCSRCHDGSIAKAPAAHSVYGSACASCHNGMSLPSADCRSCHAKAQGQLPAVVYTNDLTCADAQCHGRVKNHQGTSIAATACTTCHKAHYETMGDCTRCHTDPVSFHHGTARAVPLRQCGACHDGTVAPAPAGHDSYSKDCLSCHNGMDVPSGSCMECHAKAQGKLPAVTYTNTLSCGDAQCHAKIRNHKGTSIAAAPCSSCHKGHYQTLGACTVCHADPVRFHHGTAESVPLAQCGSCHDGSIAPVKQSHAGVACTACHEAMNPPRVPAVCQSCHDPATFGGKACTTCHATSSGMFGAEQIHAKAPAVDCAGCHKKPHYQDVGTCDSCHESHAAVHHAQATPAPTKLKLVVSKRRVKKGTGIRVGGTLSTASGAPLAGQTVVLQARRTSSRTSAFKTVSTLTTGADGRYGRSLRPRASTQYRALFMPAGQLALQQGPAVDLAKVRVVRR